MPTALSLSRLFAGQTLCPCGECESSHWSLMSVRAKQSRPWELTAPNPGPQCPQWPQTQVPRLDGTQSCESQRTWSPARLPFLYSPAHSGPYSSSSGHSLHSSLFFPSFPVAQFHLERVPDICPTHHVSTSLSFGINCLDPGECCHQVFIDEEERATVPCL